MDPFKDMVDIFLPPPQRMGQKTQNVRINGRQYLVPLGKATKVPRPVYEVLMQMLEARETTLREAEADIRNELPGGR